ncbi:hypothetical protein CC86DRAFT_293087, partial [Ophiobolus disseminans]
RCKKIDLRCFTDTTLGRCARCIAVGAKCSLFLPDVETQFTSLEKRKKRLALARLEAATAQARVELLEVED